MKSSKLIFLVLSIISSVSFANVEIKPLSANDEYGCKALLCFAGGMNEPECQSTIQRVKNDLKKGRPFPHCSFVNSNGGDGIPRIKTRTSFGIISVYVDDKRVARF